MASNDRPPIDLDWVPYAVFWTGLFGLFITMVIVGGK